MMTSDIDRRSISPSIVARRARGKSVWCWQVPRSARTIGAALQTALPSWFLRRSMPPSNYHFSLAPGSVAPSYVNFLTVLRAGQSTASYAAPTVTSLSGTKAYGTEILGLLASEASEGIVAVFADDGSLTPRTSVQYQHPARAGSSHYVAMLKPSTLYGLSFSNASGTYAVSIAEGSSGTIAIKTDSAGVLRFVE